MGTQARLSLIDFGAI